MREDGVVGLGGARGEDDRRRVVGADEVGELLARVLEPTFGGGGIGIEAARVVPEALRRFGPSLPRRLTDGRGGVVIEVAAGVVDVDAEVAVVAAVIATKMCGCL